MSAISDLIAKYEAAPGILRGAVVGMTREQLIARPVAGKWSTLECVAHIADFDLILADRIRRISALEKPLLLAADENEFVKRLGYHERDLEQELKLLEGVRAATARMLRNLPAEAFQRQGVHSLKGLITLEQAVTMAANHISSHLPHIMDKKKALGIA
jgi:hypothetical protein